MKISLEEARKRATTGDLCVVGDPTSDIPLALESDFGTVARIGPCGTPDAEDEANAALLAHCWNTHDELVEALEIAIELANMSDDEYEHQPEEDPTKALDAVLMRAKTVEMP